MKPIILALLAFIFSERIPAQSINKNSLCADWVNTKGWFVDEEINFEKLDTLKHDDLKQVILFKFDGSLQQYLYNPKHYGMCGNGMLYFSKADWKLEGADIKFVISGGRFAESKFEYIMTYTVSACTNEKLVLKKKEVLKDETKHFSD